MTDLKRRINRASYMGDDYREDLDALRVAEPSLKGEIDAIFAEIDTALAMTDQDAQVRAVLRINDRVWRLTK
jgi:hypothetical protein